MANDENSREEWRLAKGGTVTIETEGPITGPALEDLEERIVVWLRSLRRRSGVLALGQLEVTGDPRAATVRLGSDLDTK